jgi:hypothetical protein
MNARSGRGYPDKSADSRNLQVFVLAAPVLAGMLIPTGLGEQLEYRQAKVGRAVRTGGTARFVN